MGRIQVARDIAEMKAMGLPIHHTIGETLIREEADGRKFEYRLDEDGIEEILDEIHSSLSNIFLDRANLNLRSPD